MPQHIVRRLETALDQHQQKSLSASKVLIVGIAYKKNVADMRESPSLKLIELLEARGADVIYHDPHISEIPMTREHSALAGRLSAPLSAEVLSGVNAVLIATDHDSADYAAIGKHARLVVDTRNAMRRRKVECAVLELA